MNVEELSAQITLLNFGLYCVGMDQEVSSENGKIKSSRIFVDSLGRLVRSIGTRHGETQSHILTGTWSDWIDYWAVDFNYGRAAQISSPSGDNSGSPEDKPVFTSVWHSFRTPKKDLSSYQLLSGNMTVLGIAKLLSGGGCLWQRDTRG